MEAQKETHGTGSFIVSEANGTLSREVITISSGSNLLAGTVLGKVTASGEFVQLDLAATNGSEDAAGVLFAAVDATDADTQGVAIVRAAEIDAARLVWPAGITTNDKNAALAQLAALGLIAR